MSHIRHMSNAMSVINLMSRIVNSGNMVYARHMSTDKPLLNFYVDPAFLKRVDDFRFKHRFPSRAAAIKWLLDWAMDQKPAVPKTE